MNRFAVSTLFFGVLTLSSLAHADDARPPVLDVLASHGITNLQEFKVGGDIRGFAGIADDGPVTIYVTKDGNAIVGTRINAKGESIDAKTAQDLVAKPLNDATWKRLGSAKWVPDGRADAPRVVYVFTDANCPWCHRFWDAARPWVQSGKVELREILVGIIRPDSPGKAAAILGAANPTSALEQNEKNFDKGGIAAVSPVPDDVKQTLAENLKLMADLGFRGTPGIVYKSEDGTVSFLGGFPQGEKLAAVMGPR